MLWESLQQIDQVKQQKPIIPLRKSAENTKLNMKQQLKVIAMKIIMLKHLRKLYWLTNKNDAEYALWINWEFIFNLCSMTR